MSEQETWTNGSSELTLDNGGDVGINSGNDRKRTRSSDSDTSRSTDDSAGGQASQKKPKVENDISFELSEKEEKVSSIPALEKDVTEDQSSNNNSNQSDQSSHKSVRGQVEELAAERGLKTEITFVKPPGFTWHLGHKSPKAEYKVHLNLKRKVGDDLEKVEAMFSGSGETPYAAVRDASKKAREYFTNLNGEFSRHSPSPPENGSSVVHKNNENGEVIENDSNSNNSDNNGELKNDNIENVSKDDDNDMDEKSDITDGKSIDNEIASDEEKGDNDVNESDEEKDDNDDSHVEDIDDDSGDNSNEAEKQHDWVNSLESFFAKALASKLSKYNKTIQFMAKESENSIIVTCEIGKLSVEKEDTNFEKAKQSAAKSMLDTIERHLESGSDLIQKIVAQDAQVPPPPFRDETVVSEDDFEEDDFDKNEPKYIEEATLDSSDEDSTAVEAAPEAKYSDEETGSGEMVPGAEYCMALLRTDKPTDRPMVLDVANLGRRVKSGMARTLLRGLQEGDYSDTEEEEESRILENFQAMLSLCASMSERSKMRASEMFSRSNLAPIRQPTLPGMMSQMPGMMPGSQYPVHPKQRLMAAAPCQPPAVAAPPPKPVIQPLKNLCQYPQGQLGSVTVTLEDYKTLAAGTFLNDVIIDFYLKYLQYSVFDEADKNRAHIFTTFWFSRLTSKPSPIEARKDPVVRRHDRVKRWTRKVNIFEKDFVVVPINENYHWYLCIICYPGQVGCVTAEGSSTSIPARQRNRRRAKDKIKGIRAKMNAQPRKDLSDERDEPIASEDEVEHEDDSVDVDLWKRKLVEWKEKEVIRKQEEERRLLELERQRREWEEQRRRHEEEQMRLYEQRLREQEELRRQIEEEQGNEELGEEEENWDEDNLDEDGNPIEDHYDAEMMDESGLMYNEYGDPVEIVTVPGMFSDAGQYKTSLDILGSQMTSEKGQAMAAEWDDWDDGNHEMEDELKVEEKEEIPSMLSHMVTTICPPCSSSVAHFVLSASKNAEKETVDNLHNEDETMSISMVAHTVINLSSSPSLDVSSLNHHLSQLNSIPEDKLAIVEDETDEALETDTFGVERSETGMDEMTDDEAIARAIAETEAVTEEVSEEITDEEAIARAIAETEDMEVEEADATVSEEKMAQVDGINDESSDEDMEQDDDEHKVPDQELSQPADSEDNDDDHLQEDNDSAMSVEDVEQGQADTNQNDDKSDSSDSEPENVDNRDDDSSGDEDNRNDHKEVSNEAGDNYDSHEDSYASDFDEEVNERRRESDESSTETEGLDQDDKDDRDDCDTKDGARDVQSDSEIEEIEEIEEVVQKNHHENDGEEDEDNLEDEEEKSSEHEQSDSEFEEEDISNDVPVKQPCILVFDSLGGRKDRQARLCAVLRDFLTMEYQEKYPGQKREFSTRTIPGCAPKVPQQPNLTDCGIYVCHNVETFFKNPIQDYTLPINSLKKWFPDSEPRVKRRDVATLIRKLATEQNQDKLEQLIFPENMVFMEPERLRPPSVPEPPPGRSDGESDREDDREDDYFSDDDYDSDNDDRDDQRQKRYRSDISSDEDPSPRRRRRNESDDDDFDAGAVYGARQEPIPTPIRKLPPGISVSRSMENTAPTEPTAGYSQSPRTNYPTPLRKLPPGISISRSATHAPVSPPTIRSPEVTPVTTPSLPPNVSLNRQQPFVARQTIVSSISSYDSDPNNVTIDDVSDHSDHNEIFDLDDPPHTRTYLSPNSYEALQESRKFIPIPVPEELNTSFSSMLSHQAAEAVIESCLASMVTHQVFSSNTAVGDDGYDENQGNDEEVDHHENCELPQVDGMDDFDSDEEMQVVAAESVPVNEISESAAEVPIENFESEDVNQPEEVEGAHIETNDIVEAHTEAHEVTEAHIEAQEAAEAHVEAQEVAEARVEAQELAEAHVEAVGDNMEAIEVVGDNIQAVETVGDNIEAQEEFSLPETTEQHEAAVDLMEAAVVAGEIFSESIPHEFPVLNDAGNPPTEVSVDHEATEEQLVPSELVDDLDNNDEMAEVGENSIDNVPEVEDVDLEDADAEYINAETADDQQTVEEFNDEAQNVLMDEYVASEEFNEDEEDYVSEFDEDSRDINDEYQDVSDRMPRGAPEPPVKRARMSSDAEVVLDSDDDDDADNSVQAPQIAAPRAPAPLESMYQYSQMMNQTQPYMDQQKMLQEQAMMMAAAQSRGYPGGFMSAQQQQAAAIYSLQQQQLMQIQQMNNIGQSRKRKLDSMALCIKDGKVYTKSFSQLPSGLINNNKSDKKVKQVAAATQQQHQQFVYNASLTHQQLPSINSYQPNPYAPTQNYAPDRSQNPYHPSSAQNQFSAVDQIYQRLGQKHSGGNNEDNNSVENDDYRSDDDEFEVMDGQEVVNDDDMSRDESCQSDDDDIQSCDDSETLDTNQDNLVDNIESNDNVVNGDILESEDRVVDSNACDESNQDDSEALPDSTAREAPSNDIIDAVESVEVSNSVVNLNKVETTEAQDNNEEGVVLSKDETVSNQNPTENIADQVEAQPEVHQEVEVPQDEDDQFPDEESREDVGVSL